MLFLKQEVESGCLLEMCWSWHALCRLKMSCNTVLYVCWPITWVQVLCSDLPSLRIGEREQMLYLRHQFSSQLSPKDASLILHQHLPSNLQFKKTAKKGNQRSCTSEYKGGWKCELLVFFIMSEVGAHLYIVNFFFFKPSRFKSNESVLVLSTRSFNIRRV